MLSRNLVNYIYKMTNKNNLSRDFGLTSQMQRYSVSIINIAEGLGRKGKKEFIHFLYIAKGSCGELRSQFYVALDLNYIDGAKFNECHSLAETVSKSISGLKKYLQTFLRS